MKLQDVLDRYDAWCAGRTTYGPSKEDLVEALRQAVAGLDDIAKCRACAVLTSLGLPPFEFRSAMWTWSQKRARQGLGED